MSVRKKDSAPLLPSWKTLLLAAADKLRDSGKDNDADLVRSQTNAGRYLMAARDAQKGLGGDWETFLKFYLDFGKDEIDEDTLDLPKALWRLAHPVVVTTNYDRVLKLTHPNPGALNLWDIEAPTEQNDLLRGNLASPTLWYLHGRIGNASNVILTPDGYERLYGSDKAESEFSAAKSTLQALLKTHTFLFVGFSFDDPAIGTELRAFDEVMKGAGGSHYALVREEDADRLRALGLPIEPITVADHGLPLVEAVRELAALRNKASSAPHAIRVTSTPAANYSPQNPAFFVPFRAKGDGVIGREKALDAVRKQLEEGKPTGIGQTAAFKGLGGLGKTQLAVEYATTYRSEYPSGVVWLTADQEIEPQLTELAEEALWVSPQSEHRYKLDIALQRIRTFDGGLIIFDNVERYEDIEPFLPRPSASPHLLLTSRVEIPHFVPIPLSTLGKDDSFRLLLQESDRAPDGAEAEFAHRIAERLDGLPLALELAGAYLQHRGTSFEHYHGLLETSLTEALENDLLASFTKHDADLASALTVHESIVEAHPALREVLDVLTWSASAPMSSSLLQNVLPDLSPVELQKALDLGVTLRLLKRVPEQRYAIHRLVAEVRRAQTVPGNEWKQTTARRVADWFRGRRDDFTSLGAYELNLAHLNTWNERVREIDPKLAAECIWLQAYPAYHRGQAAMAEERVRMARAVSGAPAEGYEELEAHLKNDHGTTLNLLGRYEEALAFKEQALTIRRAALGEEHPDTAASLNNVGYTLGALGRHEEALEFQEQALAIRRAALGEKHPDTAASLSNVGSTLAELGRYEEALAFQKQALTIRRAALGEEHPDTATSLNNVGSTLGALGRHEEALEFMQKALAIYSAALGEEHPGTAASLNNVGSTLGDLGRHEEALAFQKQALAIRRAALGEEHPGTATSLNNVGHTLGALGSHEEALEFQEQALAIRRAALGEEHPDTAASLNNVGSILGDLGRHEEALAFKKQALAIYGAALGEEHPDTASSLNNVGVTLGDIGRNEEAQRHLQAALAIRTDRLGHEHPLTLSSLRNVAWAHGKKGHLRKALRFVEEHLKGVDRTHPAFRDIKTLRDKIRNQIPGMRKRGKRR